MTSRMRGRKFGIGALGLTLIVAAFATTSRGATAVNELATPQLLRTSGQPTGMVVDAQSGRAFVADYAENTVFVFDLATGEAVAYVGTGLRPFSMASHAGRVFVSNTEDHSITVIDAATARATKTLTIGGLGLAVNPQTARLYAAEHTRIAVVDLASDRLVGSIAAPEGADLWGVAVDAASGRVYATDIGHPRVLVFDGASGQLVREITIKAPARFGIAVGERGTLLVATYTDASPELALIDGANGQILARRAIAPFSMWVTAQPASDTVFTSSAADASVMSADTGSRATLAKAKIADGAGAVTMNPLTGAPVVATTRGAKPPARALPEVVPVVRP